jgi:hypothetical protein
MYYLSLADETSCDDTLQVSLIIWMKTDCTRTAIAKTTVTLRNSEVYTMY